MVDFSRVEFPFEGMFKSVEFTAENMQSLLESGIIVVTAHSDYNKDDINKYLFWDAKDYPTELAADADINFEYQDYEKDEIPDNFEIPLMLCNCHYDFNPALLEAIYERIEWQIEFNFLLGDDFLNVYNHKLLSFTCIHDKLKYLENEREKLYNEINCFQLYSLFAYNKNFNGVPSWKLYVTATHLCDDNDLVKKYITQYFNGFDANIDFINEWSNFLRIKTITDIFKVNINSLKAGVDSGDLMREVFPYDNNSNKIIKSKPHDPLLAYIFTSEGITYFTQITNFYLAKKDKAFYCYLYYYLLQLKTVLNGNTTDNTEYRDYVELKFALKIERVYPRNSNGTKEPKMFKIFDNIIKVS